MAERDNKGRFAKGYSGGPGRPTKQREIRYLEITKNTVSFSDWRLVILKALEQAKDGDKDARKFLAEYMVGKPTDKLEITERLSADELSDEELVELEAKLEGDIGSDTVYPANEAEG